MIKNINEEFARHVVGWIKWELEDRWIKSIRDELEKKHWIII